MTIAPLIDHEQKRLDALARYEVLNTEAEEDFDAITRLLSSICETPIALISLADRDRQWFKSTCGLDIKESPRDVALCSYVIAQTEPLVIEDTTRDPRFSRNPMVIAEPKVRFYAGAPLITPDNYVVGTLCAIDTHPKTFSANQLSALETLARHVVVLLELRLQLRETRRLNDELLKSQREAALANEYKARFFANINHEMRTPLSAVIGFNRRLQKRIANDAVPSYVPEGLSMIESASRQLNALVDQVLDMSKLEAGKMQLEIRPFDLRRLLQSVLATISVHAEECKVQLDLQVMPGVPSQLRGDDNKIAQVLLNLLSNAVKFTPPGKHVVLICRCDNNTLLLRVVDEGIGIPWEDRERIFLPFEQASNHGQTNVKGTGLGLSIVKGIVDLMQASIQVSNNDHGGSTFTLRLPLDV